MTTTRAPKRKLPTSLRWLVFLDLFVAATALIGGGGLIADPSGRAVGLSATLLEGTPFDTFLIPGIVLAVVVGGTSLVAGVAHVARWRFAGQASALAGLLLVGWIVVQVLLIREVTGLHGLYAAIGLAQLGLAFVALGRASR